MDDHELLQEVSAYIESSALAELCMDSMDHIKTKPDLARSKLALRILALAMCAGKARLPTEAKALALIASAILSRSKARQLERWLVLKASIEAQKQNHN